MPDPHQPISPARLEEIERHAREGLVSRESIGDQARDRKIVDLVEEVRRLKSLLKRIYPHVLDTPGTEELQAELEREVYGLDGPRS